MRFPARWLGVVLCGVLSAVGCGGGGGGGASDAANPGADATPGADGAPTVDAGPPDATPCPCAFENGSGHCDGSGACVLDGCDPGFDNCDGSATTGCETPLDTLTDCAGCGLACGFPNAGASCATGACVMGMCDAGFDDCDAAQPGCETPLDTLTDCGGCGLTCAFANASASCPGGTCTFGGCTGSYLDCDMNPSTGCETDSTTTTDCGFCGNVCDFGPNTVASCAAGGMCQNDGCAPNYADCNGDMVDGCEHDVLVGGPCLCVPGMVQACYTGAPGTLGVGSCSGGMQTCDPSGTAWGACLGEVLPQPEVCANGLDENCDGVIDNVLDADGDGWTTCNGDCCDAAAGCVGVGPNHVNPGALEVVGNGIDDDCDPATSDAVAAAGCAAGQKFAGVNATDVAHGMDICQTTTASPPLPLKKWGLISATQLLANGTVPNATQLSNMQNFQAALLVNYGTGGVTPLKNATMAGLSTGHMRDEGDPGYIAPNVGTDYVVGSTPPGAYLTAHGGALPSSMSCMGTCVGGTGANDPIDIRLTMRVPTNANGFSYDFRYFTADYFTYSCTIYNDAHLALLTSGAPGIPADKNIATDALGNPITVNCGFIDSCTPMGCHTCPMGTGALAGTGMEVGNTGGGTNWTTVNAPVIPGETITLDLMIFDVGDGTYDSNVLLDNFRWNLAP